MQELSIVVSEMVDAIDRTTTLFYQQKVDEGYESLYLTLGIITQGMNCLFRYKELNDKFVLDEAQLNQILSQAMAAIEEKDTILLSDILQYELKEFLQNIVID